MADVNTTKLIQHMARKLGQPEMHEDLVQEGQVALAEARLSWRQDFGAMLWTYAYKFVYGAMLRYVEAELLEPARPGEASREAENLVGTGVGLGGCARRDVAPQGAYRSMAAPVADYVGEIRSPEQDCAISQATELLPHLESKERQIVRMRHEGHTFAAITKELKLSSNDKTERVFHAAISKLQGLVLQ